MNFKVQGSIIMLMTSTWLQNQNKNIFLCLNPEWLFAYLIGCCWHELQGFCGNKHVEPIRPPPWWHHQNKEIFVYLKVDCICFFDKLLLTCISRVFQNHPWHLWAYNHADALLRIDIFRIGIFLFFWILIASFYFINCCWNELQSFYGSNHIWDYN